MIAIRSHLGQVADAFDVDVGQADQQLAHARRIGLQQGLLGFGRLKTSPDSQSPCDAPGTYLNKPNSRPDPKRPFTGLTFSQFANDTEFEIIEFDEEELTARVESVITGESAEALGADLGENEITEYRFEGGAWNSDQVCLGASLDGGFTESDGGFDDDSDFESLPEDFELAPANEVIAQRDRDESIDLAVGDSFTLPDGVVVTIRSIDVHPDYDAADTFQPTHTVDLRAENNTTEDSSIPGLALFCANTEWGGASSGEGDFNVFGDLPSGSFTEGTAALYLPEGDDGSFVTPCEDLVLRVSAFGFFSDGEPSTADYPAPAPG